MKLIAHRGYKYKENTIKAFDATYNDDDFIGIELDVRQTKDKKLVVLHDRFINRVSNGSGFVKDLTYKELLNYNFGTSKNVSKIPLLKDILKKYDKKLLLVEIKDSNIDVNTLNSLLNKHKNIYVMSFDRKYMYSLLKLNRKYKVGYLNYAVNSNDADYEFDFIAFNKNLITDKVIESFFENKTLLFVWGLFKKNKVLFNLKYVDDLYLIVNDKNISFQN